MEILRHQRPHRLVLLDTVGGTASPPVGGTASPPVNGTASPPVNGTASRLPYRGEANFDTNMVIILAALLFALVGALGLNSLVRCALRCVRRFAFEPNGDRAARLGETGLRKSALRQIPVVVYGSGALFPATDCPICLGEFVSGEEVRILPKCNHGFHKKCIDTWLLSNPSCPTCRQSLPPIRTSPATPTAAPVCAPPPGNPAAGYSAASAPGEGVLG